MVVMAAHYDAARGVSQANVIEWVLSEERLNALGVLSSIIDVEELGQLEICFAPVTSSGVIFKNLVAQWRNERGSTSSTSKMVACPAYAKIMGMGPKAIPLILAQLRSEGDNPDHWFWALQSMTLANPVADEDEGNLRRMAAAWLEWGAKEGHV